mmetsp:Transcript_16877/g.36540  ORF Transcript_16877/g.36540 Transcript_16877/m.36540 type:complete len:93 (+) Transcript_16877:100-378(+)
MISSITKPSYGGRKYKYTLFNIPTCAAQDEDVRFPSAIQYSTRPTSPNSTFDPNQVKQIGPGTNSSAVACLRPQSLVQPPYMSYGSKLQASA